MHWDPEVESPATIAVIGCGPIGIEAALYGRFLGYDVDLFDAKRPAHEVVRWNTRSMGVSVADCTTSLGISALEGQISQYLPPPMDRVWNGAEFAEEYLIPIAKSDLLVDGIHINSSVLEVGRVRYFREETCDWQARANDEFRLVVASRDRGIYTARADVVLDCRGMFADAEGYGPGGAQAVNAASVRAFLQAWLPSDPRFEIRMIDEKHVLVFGNTDLAVRFVEEWSAMVKKEENDSDKSLTRKLTWLVPCSRSDWQSIEASDPERWKRTLSKATSVVPSRGIEKVEFIESTSIWRLQVSNEDDSTREILGDVFAPFTNALPTSSIAPTLFSDQPASVHSLAQEEGECQGDFYPGWSGWTHATGEPNYYRLGSPQYPFDGRGLAEGFQQIKDVFALLGARRDLDLYDILGK